MSQTLDFFLHYKAWFYFPPRLLLKYQSAAFGTSRPWPSAWKIFFLIININTAMFFYIKNNVKGFQMRKKGKGGFPN